LNNYAVYNYNANAILHNIDFYGRTKNVRRKKFRILENRSKKKIKEAYKYCCEKINHSFCVHHHLHAIM